MEASRATWLDNLKKEIGNYFTASLTDFYGLPAHRLMIYAVTFILMGAGVFAALAVYDYSNALIDIQLKFMGINAWHAAANLTICLILIDLLFAWLVRPWGAYDRRTVGKTWIIFFAAVLTGFLSEQTLAYRLVQFYDPELFYIWKYVPSMRADALPAFLFAMPFWVVITAVLVKIMTAKQAQTETLINRRIAAILAQQARPQSAANESSDLMDVVAAPPDNSPLQLPLDPGIGPIFASDIGHVSAEDHYLRIYYYDDGKLRNTLIRMPLKTLARLLPEAAFVRIHRSHMVNLARVANLKRQGRALRLVMKNDDFELPVSRSRQPQVLGRLEDFQNP